MARFSFIEQKKFEELFGMNSGYVLDFSDRTFQEFVQDAVHINIYDEKYNYHSGSKANRLRGYWRAESNYNIGRLLEKLLEYWREQTDRQENNISANESLYKECLIIAQRLKSESPVQNLDVLTPNPDEKDFSSLVESIKREIEINKPEQALDRLHTFTTKYIRSLCDKHEIDYEPETPLHSLFGKYIKTIDEKGMIKSRMTKQILKSSISIFESFNDVRNNNSFAHDNPVLNYDESCLIVSNISTTIKFLKAVEKIEVREKGIKGTWDQLPF